MQPSEYYRRKAIEQAQLPAKLDLEQAPQMGLFGG